MKELHYKHMFPAWSLLWKEKQKRKGLCNRHTKHQGNAQYSLILLIFSDDASKLALNIILFNDNERNFLRHSVPGYDSTTYHFYTVKWPCQYWFYMKLQRDNNNSDIDENWNHNIYKTWCHTLLTSWQYLTSILIKSYYNNLHIYTWPLL